MTINCILLRNYQNTAWQEILRISIKDKLLLPPLPLFCNLGHKMRIIFTCLGYQNDRCIMISNFELKLIRKSVKSWNLIMSNIQGLNRPSNELKMIARPCVYRLVSSSIRILICIRLIIGTEFHHSIRYINVEYTLTMTELKENCSETQSRAIFS